MTFKKLFKFPSTTTKTTYHQLVVDDHPAYVRLYAGHGESKHLGQSINAKGFVDVAV